MTRWARFARLTMRHLEFGSLPPHLPLQIPICYNYPTSAVGATTRRAGPCIQPVPPILQINPPLRLDAWREQLASYPDKAFAAFLLNGIQNGFRIGIPTGFQCTPRPRNLRSALEHPDVVQAYLDREVRLGRMARLAHEDMAAVTTLGLQISPCGVIPKRNRPDKWRLIVNLSAPLGASANDTIDSELSSIAYASIDDAGHIINLLGQGCLLAKFDLQEAKLAVSWNGVTFVDRALPFGLRSAPKLFSALHGRFHMDTAPEWHQSHPALSG